jgi:integrase
MAMVEKRGDSYRIVAYLGRDIEGKQRKKTMTWTNPDNLKGKSLEKELERQKIIFQDEANKGLALDGNVKFCDFAERWIVEYSIPNHKPKTVASYRAHLERINKYLGKNRLDKLQPHQIVDFVNKLSVEKNQHNNGELISTKLQLNIFRTLSSILSTAVQWGLISENVCMRVKPPKYKATQIKCLDDFQVRTLLAVLEAEPKSNWKYTLAVKLLLFSGMRRGELVGLIWDDIDFAKCTIDISKSVLYLPEKGVYEDSTKTEGSERVIKIPQELMQELADFKLEQDNLRISLADKWRGNGHIFIKENQDVGMPIHPDSITKWFNKFLKRHNRRIDTLDISAEEKELQYLPQVSIHSLRHTTATLLILDGIDIRTVANRLGHKKPTTTINIYAYAIKLADAVASEALSRKWIGTNSGEQSGLNLGFK